MVRDSEGIEAELSYFRTSCHIVFLVDRIGEQKLGFPLTSVNFGREVFVVFTGNCHKKVSHPPGLNPIHSHVSSVSSYDKKPLAPEGLLNWLTAVFLLVAGGVGGDNS